MVYPPRCIFFDSFDIPTKTKFKNFLIILMRLKWDKFKKGHHEQLPYFFFASFLYHFDYFNETYNKKNDNIVVLRFEQCLRECAFNVKLCIKEWVGAVRKDYEDRNNTPPAVDQSPSSQQSNAETLALKAEVYHYFVYIYIVIRYSYLVIYYDLDVDYKSSF